MLTFLPLPEFWESIFAFAAEFVDKADVNEADAES